MSTAGSTAAIAASGWRCRYHAERPGVGRCVACRTTLCEECATRVDGVLHCTRCLGRPRTRAVARRWRSATALLPALAAGLAAWVLLGYALCGLAALLALYSEWLRRA